MKNLADILQSIEILQTMEKKAVSEAVEKFSPINEKLKKELFSLYSETSEILDLLNRAENCVDPDYSFDEAGLLVSRYYPKFDPKKYPFFDEFLEDCFFGYWEEKEKYLEVCHGEAITINWDHDRNSYFVHDSEAGKAVIDSRRSIEGHAEISEKAYVAAKIAEYQNKAGYFNDVVEIDSRYGQYLGHFDLMAPLVPYGIDSLDDREKINDLISRYENENEEE
jgi:hypothetical protein